MRIFLTALLAVHGFAHLVGFVVPWKLMRPEGTVYTTTILAGRLDLGDAGIRAYGILWLLAALGFWAAAVGVWNFRSWGLALAAGLAGVSLIMSALSWPDARIGIPVNLVVLAIVFAWHRMGWA